MNRDFVLVAQCEHGNNVAFIPSTVAPASLRDFIATGQFTTFKRHNIDSPSAHAAFCVECVQKRTIHAEAA